MEEILKIMIPAVISFMSLVWNVVKHFLDKKANTSFSSKSVKPPERKKMTVKKGRTNKKYYPKYEGGDFF